jgi:hypothetical protein
VKNDRVEEKKNCRSFKIKNVSRIVLDIDANREKRQHDELTRQKLVSERRDHEFRKHEKNIIAQFNEQIAIRKRVIVEAQKRQCVNRREHND